MIEAWKFRSGTLDEAIFNQVVNVNEYHLPSCFESSDIVIDVGAHIGSFAQAVVSRGCRRVYCIEPDRSNFEIAADEFEAAYRRWLRTTGPGRCVAVGREHGRTVL